MPQDAIQALDAALNSSAANNALCTTISRSCFFEGSGTFKISGGAEVSCLYQSIACAKSKANQQCSSGFGKGICFGIVCIISPDQD